MNQIPHINPDSRNFIGALKRMTGYGRLTAAMTAAYGLLTRIATGAFRVSGNSASALPRVQADGLFSEERGLHVPPRLHVSGPIEVVFHQLPDSQLRVSVEEAPLLRRVITRVDGDLLIIDLEPERASKRSRPLGGGQNPPRDFTGASRQSGRVIVGIAAPRLRDVSVTGAAVVDLSSIAADELLLRATGAGRINGRGECGLLTAEASGSAVVKCTALWSKGVTVDVSGAGILRVHAESYVRGRVSGSGVLAVSGQPRDRSVKRSGSGLVQYK